MTCPQYSLPPLIETANSDSETLIQVVRQRVELSWRRIAVSVQGHLQSRLPAVLSGGGQFVDHPPQFALGLFDQAAHRTRVVQQDRQLDQGSHVLVSRLVRVSAGAADRSASCRDCAGGES